MNCLASADTVSSTLTLSTSCATFLFSLPQNRKMEEAKADPVEIKRIPLYEYRYLRLMTGSCVPGVLNSSVDVAVEVQ